MDAIISAKDINIGYKKDEIIIKNATFSIFPKDFVFISGKSGSGKSTLIRSFYGNLPVYSGNLFVNGFNMKYLSKYKLSHLRRSLGIVFQDYKLIQEWNVEKNIALPMIINGFSKTDISIQVEKLLSHINLTHRANKYPMELSGGEQQRVALARAISHRPKIILCDEPTGNLDDYSSDMIWNLLRASNLRLNMTIVVVTHKLPQHLDIEYRKINIEDGVLREYA